MSKFIALYIINCKWFLSHRFIIIKVMLVIGNAPLFLDGRHHGIVIFCANVLVGK